MADFLFAAWFAWMTPLLTALSSFFEAACNDAVAVSTSPASAASRKRPTRVLSSDLTALLRSRRRSLVRLRLICDLMLATRGNLVVELGTKSWVCLPHLWVPGRERPVSSGSPLEIRHARTGTHRTSTAGRHNAGWARGPGAAPLTLQHQ